MIPAFFHTKSLEAFKVMTCPAPPAVDGNPYVKLAPPETPCWLNCVLVTMPDETVCKTIFPVHVNDVVVILVAFIVAFMYVKLES